MSKTVTSRFVLKGDNQLNSAFGKAKAQLGGLARQASLYGAAAIAAGAAIVKAQATAIDSLAKTADVVGVGIESLQAYRHAAELAGISNKGIDDSLKRLSRRAGEFANSGGGPAAKAFDQLGISIRDTNGKVKNTEQLFDEITAAMQGVETDSQRAALAAQLFGDDFGPKLVPLLNQGTAGIEAARETLEDLGVVITESEAAGVERMNDAMTTASEVGTGLAQKFTAELAPAIAAIAEEFIESSKESGGFGEEVAVVAEKVAQTIGFVADVVDSVGRAFKIAANIGIIGFEGLKVTVISLADTIINGPTQATNDLIELLNKLPGVNIDYRFSEIAPGIKADMALSASIVDQAIAEIHAIMMEPLPSTGIEARLQAIKDQLNALPAAAAESKEMVDETLSGIDRSASTTKEKLEEAATIPASMEKATESVNNLMSSFENSGTDAFMSIVTGSQSAAEAFSNMAKSILSDIARMIVQTLILRSISSLFGGFAVKSDVGGLLEQPGMFADGGDFMGGKPIIVGERGPELIVPQNSGTVIPNHALGGGGGVTVNIDARQSDDPGRLLALVPVIQEQIEASIALKQRRGYL